MAIANKYDDEFTHARGQMPTNPEPARPFSPPPSPSTSSGLTENASNSVALNGAATTNRGESVIAVMRAADSTANMRTAFGQWRGVATEERAKKSLSELAFWMERFESEGESKGKSETVVATNAVDQSAGRDKTDESPTNGASKAGFEAKRVPNYNPLGSGPQTGAGLAKYAFEMSPFSSPGANGGGQSPDTVVVGSTRASEISSPGSSQGNSPGQ